MREPTLQEKLDFIVKMLPIAKVIKENRNIEKIITLTQSSVESGWGVSGLTVQANNLFGFTAGSWIQKHPDKLINLPTKENIKKIELTKYQKIYGDVKPVALNESYVEITIPRWFRRYDSWLESTQNWADTIATLGIYKKSYGYAQIGDIINYATSIREAGYMTDIKGDKALILRAKEVEALM